MTDSGRSDREPEVQPSKSGVGEPAPPPPPPPPTTRDAV